MATRWAVANGNWSSTSTWDGGTLPTSADDVFADGRTVTIDQNVTVLSLRTTQRTGGTAGGGFTTAGQFNVTATGLGIVPGTTTCLTYTGDVTVIVNANCAGSTNGVWGVLMSGASGNLTVNGNLNGSNSTSAAVNVSGNNATVTIVGNITGGGVGTTAFGLYLTGTSVKAFVTGLVSGNVGGAAINSPSNNVELTVTGNCIGANANNGPGIQFSGTLPIITVTGNVTGQTAQPGISATGSGPTINVTGNVTAGAGQTGITASGANSTVTVIGSVTATSFNHGLRCDATSSGFGARLQGSLTDDKSGMVAVYARFIRMTGTNSGITRYANAVGYPNDTMVSRVSPDLATGVPAASNVRFNTVYGFENQLTGTLRVPPTNAVASGVPVDNTVGTAAVRLEDIAAVTGAQIAAAVSTPSTI